MFLRPIEMVEKTAFIDEIIPAFEETPTQKRVWGGTLSKPRQREGLSSLLNVESRQRI
jgi:hypothetical protein